MSLLLFQEFQLTTAGSVFLPQSAIGAIQFGKLFDLFRITAAQFCKSPFRFLLLQMQTVTAGDLFFQLLLQSFRRHGTGIFGRGCGFLFQRFRPGGDFRETVAQFRKPPLPIPGKPLTVLFIQQTFA